MKTCTIIWEVTVRIGCHTTSQLKKTRRKKFISNTTRPRLVVIYLFLSTRSLTNSNLVKIFNPPTAFNVNNILIFNGPELSFFISIGPVHRETRRNEDFRRV